MKSKNEFFAQKDNRQMMGKLYEEFKYLTFLEFDDLFHNTVKTSIPEISIESICAFARKYHEYGHFGDNLQENVRVELIQKAEKIILCAINQSDTDTKKNVELAWEASNDYSSRFGYQSGAIYEALAPHNVFKT